MLDRQTGGVAPRLNRPVGRTMTNMRVIQGRKSWRPGGDEGVEVLKSMLPAERIDEVPNLLRGPTRLGAYPERHSSKPVSA